MAISCPPDLQASNSRVLITGATGFIGRRIVSVLPERGFTARALIRPGKTSDARLPAECEQVPANLTDVEALAGAVAGCGAVVYCAGSVRGRTFADFATANVAGVKAMLEVLEHSEKKPPLLLISSLAASRPELSDYSSSKRAGEKALQEHPNLAWTVLRPPAVYGPGDREMLPVFKMIRRGLLFSAGPAGQRLSLLHVDDLADAVTSWLAAPQRCLHETYAIDDGTPGGYSWPAMGEAVSETRVRLLPVPRFLLNGAAHLNLLASGLFAYAPMLTPGKVRELVQQEWLCDNREFTVATGWRPKLDLKRGVRGLFKSKNGISSG